MSPPFYWRNLTWTRYSPVVPRREEFESSDKQSREPPEKYNYGDRCIRCAEAIRLSPNALWNRRASFELKTARLSTLTLSGLDHGSEKEQQHEFTPSFHVGAAPHRASNMDRRSVLFSGIDRGVPRARPVRTTGKQVRVGPAARHGTRRKHSCAAPTPSFVPRHSAQTALTLNKVQPRATWFTRLPKI